MKKCIAVPMLLVMVSLLLAPAGSSVWQVAALGEVCVIVILALCLVFRGKKRRA